MKGASRPGTQPKTTARRGRAARDLVIAVAAVIAALLVGMAFDLYERFGEFAADLESWQIDELPIALLALALSVAWFAHRRYTESLAEITEREQAEEALRSALKEKEVLLREIHHRVKDNLQVISSLLNLQAAGVKDKQALEMLKESQSRVRSLALIHEKLYRSEDLVGIDFAGYIDSLAADLFRSYGVNSEAIALKINVDQVSLDVDTAMPCGLIINELVSNSLKHAFPAGKEGEIRIELRADNGNGLTLIVSDNGVGFPKGLDFRRTESFGLQVVCTFTDQLGGAIGLRRSGGTEFKVEFPASQQAETD